MQKVCTCACDNKHTGLTCAETDATTTTTTTTRATTSTITKTTTAIANATTTDTFAAIATSANTSTATTATAAAPRTTAAAEATRVRTTTAAPAAGAANNTDPSPAAVPQITMPQQPNQTTLSAVVDAWTAPTTAEALTDPMPPTPTTTSATTSTTAHTPQSCHGVAEHRFCGSRFPVSDCTDDLIYSSCPVMCDACTTTIPTSVLTATTATGSHAATTSPTAAIIASTGPHTAMDDAATGNTDSGSNAILIAVAAMVFGGCTAVAVWCWCSCRGRAGDQQRRAARDAGHDGTGAVVSGRRVF